ncbi:MAG: cation transporter [Clostridia bacterium]|nr:cation transporter [Clostridia bacterium]
MIKLLSKIFIKDNDYSDSAVRSKYGVLCGIVGIILNILLCCAKLAVSLITGSVAISADAFNNLGDAGSSVITLIGFKLADQKPDESHPFGHGRMEYLSALIVSMLIMLMGFELGKTSVSKIAGGESPVFSYVAVIVLGLSVLVKLYIFLYNRSIGNKINSQAMKATAVDSLTDCVSTFAVLICTVLSLFVNFNFDGWCGLVISAFIIFSGIKAAKETIDPLLGTPPEGNFVKNVEEIVLSYPEIVGIHDLVVHNYGPGRVMLSLHAEVSQSIDILIAHDIIDNAEQKLSRELKCSAVIHLDPIATDDEKVNEVRFRVSELAKAIHPQITIHDFRMVVGDSHTNLIFDMSVPFSLKRDDDDIKKEMARLVKIIDEKYLTVICIDKEFIKDGK